MKKLLLLQEVHDQRTLKTEWLQLAPPPAKYREMIAKVISDKQVKLLSDHTRIGGYEWKDLKKDSMTDDYKKKDWFVSDCS